ncbi:hypothetical protein LBMAG53_06860 [Planctomycetota bacterium]|nr:hypothetical protein LBMAG53_06860 [Planctomycetota bacterium]
MTITDLTGCFACDGVLHPDLERTAEGLPQRLPDSVFRTGHARRQPTAEAETMDLGSVIAEDTEELLPRLDEVVDKYRIEQELGRGGFAAVFRATHLLMRSTVALKLLFPRMLRKYPQLAETLCEEARLTSLIDHPNVVKVLDVTTTPRFTYIIMEYIEGVSLGRAILRKPIDPANVLKIGIHLCGGLQAAAEQGLIHRDIKPGNILVARTGQAKLVDFGLARRVDDLRRSNDSSSTGKRIAGTPAYIAPEQASTPDAADHRADIYSLGATLYHAAVGRPPFPSGTPMQMILSHINSPPPPPENFRPDLPAGLSTILLRMLAKRPEDRPQTYVELGEELMRVYRNLRPQTTTMTPSSSTDPAHKPALMGKLRGLFSPRTP